MNWLDCIKNRRDPIASAEVGHRSVTVCHLANISLLLGRKLQWNPDTERFVDDDEANRMLHKSCRAPWGLDIQTT